MLKKFFKGFKRGEKGFTLIELLVVVAILGVLAAVAVPNVGKFINKGKTESQETELHNLQTAVMAMMADSTTGLLVPEAVGEYEMENIVTTDTTPLVLSDYMTGLGDFPKTTSTTETTAVKSGRLYTFTNQGTVAWTGSYQAPD